MTGHTAFVSKVLVPLGSEGEYLSRIRYMRDMLDRNKSYQLQQVKQQDQQVNS